MSLASFDAATAAETGWITYNASDSGLANNNVKSIAIDSSGNKWFGTYGYGVSKYNGINWTTYNTSNSGLPGNYITSMAVDSSDNKWFGTHSGGYGVSKFDGTNWTTYNRSNSGLGEDEVFSIAMDSSSNMWFGTYGGVSKFDGTNWTTYGVSGEYVSAIAKDNSGNMWFGAWDWIGVSKFDGTNWTRYETSNNIGSYVNSIAKDSSGNMWFGTNDGGVSKFDGTNWTIYNTSNSGLINDYVTSIAVDSGSEWFGTWGGISKFDGTNWTIYTSTNSGLVDNYITSIAIDSSDNKWFGTYDGVLMFSVGTITISSTSDTYVSSGTEYGLVSVQVPAGAFTDNVTLIITTTVPPVTDRATIKVTGVGLDISNDKGLQPLKGLTLTVNYRDSDVVGYDESKLVLGRYDETNKRWIALPSTVYPDQNKVVGTTNHLSRFALIQLVPSADLSMVHVYPNPYKPSDAQFGDTSFGTGIVFSGLTAQAHIRIYNIAGELVKSMDETTGNGTCLWDTKNKKGSKVASGVYIYLITNPADGSQKAHGKFAVIR